MAEGDDHAEPCRLIYGLPSMSPEPLTALDDDLWIMDRLVISHGRNVETGAHAYVEEAFAWLG